VLSQNPTGGGFPLGGQAAMFPGNLTAPSVPAISGLEFLGGNFSALDGIGGLEVPVGGACVASFTYA